MGKLRITHVSHIISIIIGIIVISGVYVFLKSGYIDSLFVQDGMSIKPIYNDGSVKELLIQERTDTYDLSASYPEHAPQEVLEFIEGVLATFRGYDYTDVGSEKYTLNLDYVVHETDAYISYIIEFYEYTGGANGNGVQETFVFNHDGSRATFEQVFAPETKAQVLEKLWAQLEQEYSDSLFEDSLTVDSPALENFFVSKEGVGFAFSEYDILPGVYGPVTVMYGKPGQTSNDELITDFDSCAAAGNPIAESYPRQCFHEGQSFIEEVEPIKGPEATGGCVVGGCSGQLCISAEEAAQGGGISTCEFREEYACYQDAVCEKQATSSCGWTMDAKLTQCLQSPPALQ